MSRLGLTQAAQGIGVEIAQHPTDPVVDLRGLLLEAAFGPERRRPRGTASLVGRAEPLPGPSRALANLVIPVAQRRRQREGMLERLV